MDRTITRRTPGRHMTLNINNEMKPMTRTRDMDRLVNDIKGLRAPLLLSGHARRLYTRPVTRHSLSRYS